MAELSALGHPSSLERRVVADDVAMMMWEEKEKSHLVAAELARERTSLSSHFSSPTLSPWSVLQAFSL